MSSGSATATSSLNDLAASIESQPLPTVVEVFRLGRILADPSHKESIDIAFRHLLDSLPMRYRRALLSDLNTAVFHLLEQASTDGMAAVAAVFRCVAEIDADSIPLWSLEELTRLAEMYETTQDDAIVSLLSVLLLVLSQEDLMNDISMLMDHNLWSKLVDDPVNRRGGWKKRLMSRVDDETTVNYLTALLESASMEEEPSNKLLSYKSDLKPSKTTKPKVVSPAEALQQRIDAVRAVLPDLGEGFVEVALSLNSGNVEQTLSLLLDDEAHWPTQLTMMDRSLPRRRRDDERRVEEEEEARIVAKKTIQAVAAQEQAEASAVEYVMRHGHDEYDDDYDDQYDDVDAIGGADQGLYDIDDYQAVRTYNQAVKNVEAEQEFWQANRNTNREARPKKEFGPDKMRVGRIPGAGRGGGHGRGRGGRDGQGESAEAGNTEGGGDESKETSEKKPNHRKKAANLAKRRDKQKQAAAKRSG